MKSPASFILAGTLAAIGMSAIAAGQAPAAYTPLRPVSQCLRPDRINEWYVVDSSTLIARTGPDHYLVKLQAVCPQLGIGQSLRFRANPSNTAAGRARCAARPARRWPRVTNRPVVSSQSPKSTRRSSNS